MTTLSINDILTPDTFTQDVFIKALTHKSFHNENLLTSMGHNEQLEFLGDAVLDLALSELLMQHLPLASEGDLSRMRASLVNEATLNSIALKIGLDRLVRLGKGELASGGSRKPRLLASALEAVIGALFILHRYEYTRNFLNEIFKASLAELDQEVAFRADYKTRLQEIAQDRHRATPVYELLSETGPDHDKVFVVKVMVGGKPLGEGSGRSKKQAEQEAAKQAVEGWL